jgi:hypothetical protein
MTVPKIAALTGLDRGLLTRLLYEAASGGEARPRPAAVVAPPPGRGPSEAELLAALYADPEVLRVLDRHGVPARAPAGPPWQRFPAPRPLTATLVGDLYEGCGLSLHHIELLTGRPAAAVGGVLRTSGIKLRPPGGRSPFTDRWRPVGTGRGALTSSRESPNEFHRKRSRRDLSWQVPRARPLAAAGAALGPQPARHRD